MKNAATLAAGAALTLLSLAAHGQEPMVLCVEDQPASPYTFPTRDGTMQVLVKMAAKQADVPVTLKVQPWKRCIEEVRAGTMSGMLNAGYTPFHAEYAAFPMQGGKPNTAQSLAKMDIMAFRVKGGKADWDGAKFSHVSKPVLIPSGFATISDQLKAMNVPFDDNTKEPARNFYKLIAGQGDILLGFDGEMQTLVAGRKDVQDKVEMLPAKFMTADFYLAVSKSYYSANKDKVEALWAAIGKVRKSKEYQDAVKDIR
jgi:polar amino acid transport system substrate-binding protein